MASNDKEGYPYITPVNFVFHEGNIYFHCAPVERSSTTSPVIHRVCFQVDIPLAYLDAGYDSQRRASKLHQLYHCVIIRGEASVLPDGPVKTVALNALVAEFRAESACAAGDGGPAPLHSLRGRPDSPSDDYHEERPRPEQDSRGTAGPGAVFQEARQAWRPGDGQGDGI